MQTKTTIKKSMGQSETEKVLARLCDRTFLKLWAYPNLYRADGKELCDLLAVFENHVFLFFDRESKKLNRPESDILLQWDRWKKEVIEKQIATLEGAKRYLLSNPNEIYLDPIAKTKLPVSINIANTFIHKIVVAHGAQEACKSFSEENIYGSLAIGYGDEGLRKISFPFMVHLDKLDPVHIFDSCNLEIVLTELDTFYDFVAYITEKEEAIKRFDGIFYCGEEDLLAYYFLNYNESENKYNIGRNLKDVNGIFIPEGQWYNFIKTPAYRMRKQVNEAFRLWDDLIQKTCQNAFDGSLRGNGSLFNAQSAIYEMAKEPRFTRRVLSEVMIRAMESFPEDMPGIARNISFMPSFYEDVGYVFLQVKHPKINDYDNEYRPRRQAMLEIACGVAKNKFPHLHKVIGIGIDAPKFSRQNAEDFILLDCKDWTEQLRSMFEHDNKELKFFESARKTTTIRTMSDFPIINNRKPAKVGRNDKCPCGSGLKYKKCCGR